MVKKICVLTTAHPAMDVRIFHKEARTLAAAGFRVEIIGRHPKKEIIDGVAIIPVPPAKNRFSRFFLMPVKMFFWARERNADAYHFHDPELIFTGLCLKFFCGKIAVYDSHEDAPRAVYHRRWLPGILKTPVSLAFNAAEKTAARFFDRVIGATPHITGKFKSCRAKTISNYPLASYFQDFFSNAADKKDNRRFIAVYSGNFEEVRGIKQIVDAVGIVDPALNASLVLAGKFSEEDYKAKVMASAGWERVEFLGWRPLKESYAAVAKADAGLACFLRTDVNLEAVPNKIFEYMAAGLPLIYSDFPLWRRIIGGCGIAVDPSDPRRIAAAIEYLAKNREIARGMGEKGKEMVKECYNWEKEGEKLVDVYRKL